MQAFRQLLREHDGRELSQAQFDAHISGRANGELFAELFPLSSQALAFDDSLPGVKAASDAGIFTVGIATTQTTERLLAAGARWVIEETTHGCGR